MIGSSSMTRSIVRGIVKEGGRIETVIVWLTW